MATSRSLLERLKKAFQPEPISPLVQVVQGYQEKICDHIICLLEKKKKKDNVTLESLWQLFDEIKNHPALSPDQKIACLSAQTHIGTTLAMFIVKYEQNEHNAKFQDYLTCLSNLLEQGANPDLIVDLLNKKRTAQQENFTLIIASFGNLNSINLFLNLLKNLQAKIPAAKKNIGVSFELINQCQGSFFEILLKRHALTAATLNIFYKLFELDLLSQDDYKKEALLKKINNLAETTEEEKSNKINLLSAYLNPNSKLGLFSWKKRGLNEPELGNGTFIAAEELLKRLSPNHPFFQHKLAKEYSVENLTSAMEKENREIFTL